ncbi:DUF4747 family protein [Stenotrophomonas maltophilia]|uniref:DUF4747 family protein n=1 Tax=Stenotrophomonas maltophilia TaxID=40324 RepID=UPI0015DF42E5|nr:DUF4747 family protein [Stenotrophomonas maltophilia]MBA0221796.1 DUF4747 family protein [Stenotrophomonas maltophilia]
MEKKVTGTLINVAVHPHDGPNTYLRLFESAYGLDRAVRVHGDRYAWMSHLWINGEGSKQFLTGHIATFSQIDMDGAWIDMTTRSTADAGRIDSIKKVVKDVQPNYHEFRFYVGLKEHLVAVETDDGKRTFSPRMAEKFFREIFSAASIVDEFGEAEVCFVPDRESLNRIIGSKYLRKLEIHLTRPNADSVADIEKRVMDELEKFKARAATHTYTAVRGQTLEVSEDVKNLARVARTNGYVEGNVAGEIYSTKDHPIERVRSYDSDAQSQELAFNDLAVDLIRSEINP